MKNKIRIHLLAVVYLLGSTGTLYSQNINVVPNPTSPGSFSWTAPGALSGYSGNPIVFNNSLLLEYNGSTTSNPTQIVQQLAVFKDGDSLHLIPNPDGGQGVYLQSVHIVFNNLFFFIYLNATGVQQLASFDGTSITLYPNPDAGLGYIGSPRIYNNALYLAYSNASGTTQFGRFNGSGIVLIPNPDNSSQGFFNDYAVVFDNKICSRYISASSAKQLAVYDGTSWTLLPNPDATTNRGFQPLFPVEYHSKLYWIYFGIANQYQFAVYDGTNNPTLIANPEDDSPNQGGVSGFPIIYDDTLFLQYADINNVGRLAKCDGTSISLVPNPDNTTYGFYNTPIVYNNTLYIFYVTSDGKHHLGEYQTASNSLKVYPNPDAGSGYWDQPIVYNGHLYFIYYNASGLSQLGYFDGSSIKLVANPSGAYNSPNGNNGYLGQPIIWNNLLYLQMASVPYSNAGNLAYIDGSTLPVTLLSFTAQKNGNTAQLQWKVTNEINNAYFSVEHSANGINFTTLGKVEGHGTVSLEQNYQFTDNHPLKGLNFYRLQQVDIDGNFTYSNIASVDFNNGNKFFNIYPNPATDHVRLSIPVSPENSFISVFDLNGKKIMAERISSNITEEVLDVSTLSAGIYQVRLVQGTQRQTLKLLKK